MTGNDLAKPVLDFTAKGVEFSPWRTEVESDELVLGRLSFDVGSPLITVVEQKVTFALPRSSELRDHELEATFISLEKKAVIRFGFDGVIAFRVLDENGLLELWNKSAVTRRPAPTTFRARGHKWQGESFLVFLDQGDIPRYSYFVATGGLCIEVVCAAEPSVTNLGAAIITSEIE